MFSREQSACTEFFSMRKLRSRLSLFSRKEGQPSASRGSRPTVAKAQRGMSSWGSQEDLADELERGLSFSRSSAANEGEMLDDDDAISLTSSDPAACALLVMPRKSRRCLRAKKLRLSPLSPPALRMIICWRLWYTWGKKKIASIGFSIPVMLTVRECVETAMRDAPCGRDASQLSLCG